LLRELLYLELPPNHTTNNDNADSNSYTNNCNNSNNDGTDSDSSSNGNGLHAVSGSTGTTSTIAIKSSQQHLIELYPLFCECITSSEKDLKDLLKEIFYLVGKEFLGVKRL
jgi:hypothetical protein